MCVCVCVCVCVHNIQEKGGEEQLINMIGSKVILVGQERQKKSGVCSMQLQNNLDVVVVLTLFAGMK